MYLGYMYLKEVDICIRDPKYGKKRNIANKRESKYLTHKVVEFT